MLLGWEEDRESVEGDAVEEDLLRYIFKENRGGEDLSHSLVR